MLFEKKTNLLFLLRELVCVFIARTQGKKKIFLLHELVNGPTAGNQKKKILFTARTYVFLLRELNQKNKKILFTARTRAWSHKPSTRKKNMFFYCTNSIKSSWEIITIYMSGKKIDILYYAKKKNSFHCKNTMKLRRVHTARTRFFFSRCMNCIQSLSNSYSAHQLQTSKKRNLFDCANSHDDYCFYYFQK